MGIKQILVRASLGSFIILVFGIQPLVFSQSASPNYKVEESYFGTGGEVDANSASYRARQSSGALGVGDSASANYRASSGFGTPDTGFLEFVTTGATVDLGVLADTTTSFGAAQAGGCNCSFYIRTYVDSQYAVTTMSNPPSSGAKTLTAKTVLGFPSLLSNVEEFGINLVANASPAIGANPSNQPDGTFADGTAAAGYNTPDQFKYVAGDVVARSPATAGNQAIGLTNYTISYIAKKNSITPAGAYIMKHDLVATTTF